MRPVTGSLSGKVNLPCFFHTIPTSAPVLSPNGTTVYSRDYLRIKWTKIEGNIESTVLVAQNGMIKIGSSYRNRVSVPSHPEDVGDASLTMVKLRASDSGTYRCEVMYGIEDTQDTVNLDVNGEKFAIFFPFHTRIRQNSLKLLPQEEGGCMGLIIVKCNTSADRNVNFGFPAALWNCSNNLVFVQNNHRCQLLPSERRHTVTQRQTLVPVCPSAIRVQTQMETCWYGHNKVLSDLGGC